MNLAENKFLLTNIMIENENAIFEISLISNSLDIISAYFNNYFEGIYIEIENKMYNMYAKKTEHGFMAELRHETIAENATDIPAGKMKLFVALRMGIKEIYQPIELCPNDIRISFGHWNTYYFAPVSDFEFDFLKCTPFIVNIKETAMLKSVKINNDVVEICTSVPEKLSNCNISLVRYDLSDGTQFELESQTAKGTNLVFNLNTNELLALDPLYTGENLFGFKLLSNDGKLCEITVDGALDFERMPLITEDCHAVLFKRNNSFAVRIKQYLFFEFCGTENDKIMLKFHKPSYPLEIVGIIAQRVNTDIEYSLPIDICEKEVDLIITVSLKFGVNEEAFKKSVYQFWAIVRDGMVTNRVMLKILRNEELSANTYLVQKTPYSIIGEHYYNCIFYCDVSNSLKCIIDKKFLKAGVKCSIDDGMFSFKINVMKEPFFDENIKLSAVSESGAEICAEKYKTDENNTSFTITALYNPVQILSCACGETIWLFLTFGGRDSVKTELQNTLKGIPSQGRENAAFSEIVSVNGRQTHVWTDFKNGAFAFGVSDDLQLCAFENAECVNKEIIITASVTAEYEALFAGGSVTVELENVIDKSKIQCGIDTRGTETQLRISAALTEFGDYRLFLRMDGDIKTSITYAKGAQVFSFGDEDKKIELRKNNGSLSLSVQELLLFENAKKFERCQKLAKKAIENSKSKNRKVWLVGENYGLSARDNGLAFFDYCMTRENIDAEIYFVTKSSNKDISALAKYEKNVILYDSDKHIELDAIAEFYIVSHGVRDVMPSLYHNQVNIYRKPIIYLQHGIMAMKIIGISNSSYGGSIRRFIVSSQYEKRLLTKRGQFWDEEIAVTGLARYDKLVTCKELEQNYIWIMPTWRDWLVSSRENFINTEFYRSYQKLLTDEKLLNKLRESGCKLVFSLHIEFEKYKPLFDIFSNDIVEITDMHSVDISRRIRECKMIVTDYSSVMFDVVYLNKPALFFQFDKDMYDVYRGSYLNMETDLPGKVLHTWEELSEAIAATIESGFEIPAEFAPKRKKFFDFGDQKNSERIYETVLEVREEMSDEY